MKIGEIIKLTNEYNDLKRQIFRISVGLKYHKENDFQMFDYCNLPNKYDNNYFPYGFKHSDGIKVDTDIVEIILKRKEERLLEIQNILENNK